MGSKRAHPSSTPAGRTLPLLATRPAWAQNGLGTGPAWAWQPISSCERRGWHKLMDGWMGGVGLADDDGMGGGFQDCRSTPDAVRAPSVVRVRLVRGSELALRHARAVGGAGGTLAPRLQQCRRPAWMIPGPASMHRTRAQRVAWTGLGVCWPGQRTQAIPQTVHAPGSTSGRSQSGRRRYRSGGGRRCLHRTATVMRLPSWRG